MTINPLAALGANPLIGLFRCIAREGLFQTAKIVMNTVLDIGFDLQHGTDTVRRVEIKDLKIECESTKNAGHYQPTQAGPLRNLMRKLDLPKDGVFVDMGSGKGRVLLIAAQLGFNKIVGVEFSGELCEIARDNVKAFMRKVPSSARIDVVESDVAAYAIEPDQTVFFIYNPFDDVVMNRLLENLWRSVTQFPRKIWFLYNNPIHSELVDKSRLFRTCRLIEIGGTRFRVYRN